jgi:ATP-binding cassette, subfamily B, bacterial HlyB/CyaB
VATYYPLKLEGFVWALSAFCQLNRIPFNTDLLVKQHPPPYTSIQLETALQSYGFTTALKPINLAQLTKSSVPCLAILSPVPVADAAVHSGVQNIANQNAQRTPEEQAATIPPPHPLALILGIDHAQDRVLMLEAGQTQPKTCTLAEASAHYAGHCLMVRKVEETVADDAHAVMNDQGANPQAAHTKVGNATNTPKAFGFKWFIPELLKYKKIWSEVLTSSLAIQLVGLAVPICTQIVIDKVVVHHTTSTLIVIGTALFIFLIFSSAMGWVRQYLVLRTGNRIDATLGHKVFSHLLDLPVRYYDHRPTGVIIARVHGVETIREFLAGGLAPYYLISHF